MLHIVFSTFLILFCIFVFCLSWFLLQFVEEISKK